MEVCTPDFLRQQLLCFWPYEFEQVCALDFLRQQLLFLAVWIQILELFLRLWNLAWGLKIPTTTLRALFPNTIQSPLRNAKRSRASYRKSPGSHVTRTFLRYSGPPSDPPSSFSFYRNIQSFEHERLAFCALVSFTPNSINLTVAENECTVQFTASVLEFPVFFCVCNISVLVGTVHARAHLLLS